MVNIYVLKLKYSKYYVGKTNNTFYRLTDHFSEGGSAWTKKYQPISVIEVRKNCKDVDEQIVTQDYMKKYGIKNVRGGPWCQVDLPEETVMSIQHIIDANNDKCYKCGKTGHFANNCESVSPSKKTYKKKPNKCYRCGRSGHTKESCYAKTDVDGFCIDYGSSTDEQSTDEYFDESDLCDEYSSVVTCHRCGRKGHLKSDCYATNHVRGYYLRY